MTLREQVIARIYEECADFPERTGLSEEDSCRFATVAGGWLRAHYNTEPQEFVPRFVWLGDGRVNLVAMNYISERLLSYEPV